MYKKLILATTVAAFTTPVYSTEKEGWSGKGELGFVSVEGNTQSQLLNAALEFTHTGRRWDNTAKASATNAESSADRTAESYFAEWVTHYNLNEREFVFADLRYLEDKFDSFVEIITAGAGYGRRLIRNDTTKWNISIGAGYRDTEIETTGEDISAETFLADSSFRHKLTKTTTLNHELRTEANSENTFVQNDLGLAVSMTDTLAMKISYVLRYNSDPFEGDESTDTITSVNIVYNFE